MCVLPCGLLFVKDDFEDDFKDLLADLLADLFGRVRPPPPPPVAWDQTHNARRRLDLVLVKLRSLVLRLRPLGPP